MKIFIPILLENNAININYMLSLVNLILFFKENDINAIVYPIKYQSTIHKRNIALSIFIDDSSYTHILFIDKNIEFETDDIIRMLLVNKDIVCTSDKLRSNDTILQEIDKVDLDILLIKRDVIHKMIISYQNKKYQTSDPMHNTYNVNNLYDFFSIKLNTTTSQYETEEEYFSKLWKNIDGRIYTLSNISIKKHTIS